MAQNGGSGLDAGGRFNAAGHTGGMSDALGIYNDVMLFAALPVGDNVVDNLLLVVVVILRKQNILSAVGDAAPQGDIACVTSHNLDDAAALMGCRGITYLINGFHGCIHCCIEADGVLGTGDIQVDGAWYADGIDA